MAKAETKHKCPVWESMSSQAMIPTTSAPNVDGRTIGSRRKSLTMIPAQTA